jgi:hypothetical protein
MTGKAKQGRSSDDDSAFTDVSKHVETLQTESEKPDERDDDGNVIVSQKAAEANEAIADEQAVRASAQVEGGGPWPEDLLVERFANEGAPVAREL